MWNTHYFTFNITYYFITILHDATIFIMYGVSGSRNNVQHSIFFPLKVRVMIDEAIMKNEQALVAAEKTRSAALREVGNHLHESVPVDDDEDHNAVERTFGDCSFRQKYSHVDLICMIDGNLTIIYSL